MSDIIDELKDKIEELTEEIKHSKCFCEKQTSSQLKIISVTRIPSIEKLIIELRDLLKFEDDTALWSIALFPDVLPFCNFAGASLLVLCKDSRCVREGGIPMAQVDVPPVLRIKPTRIEPEADVEPLLPGPPIPPNQPRLPEFSPNGAGLCVLCPPSENKIDSEEELIEAAESLFEISDTTLWAIKLKPVNGKNGVQEAQLLVLIDNNCSKDGICVPQLIKRPEVSCICLRPMINSSHKNKKKSKLKSH